MFLKEKSTQKTNVFFLNSHLRLVSFSQWVVMLRHHVVFNLDVRCQPIKNHRGRNPSANEQRDQALHWHETTMQRGDLRTQCNHSHHKHNQNHSHYKWTTTRTLPTPSFLADSAFIWGHPFIDISRAALSSCVRRPRCVLPLLLWPPTSTTRSWSEPFVYIGLGASSWSWRK